MFMRKRRDVPIDSFATTTVAGRHRASAMVDGTEVWFESTVPLRANPEVFGSAFLIPALVGGSRLAIEGKACPIWYANVERLLDVLHRWWGTRTVAPSVNLDGAGRPKSATTGLCFSGGVDSFHSLLRSGEPIELLVTAVGFDIPLDDSVRSAALQSSLAEISGVLGIRSVEVRTNFRAHPLVLRTPWESAHGGALAAIGHALSEGMGRLVVSSSVPLRSRRKGWGSHWKIDPLWSSSDLELIHWGAESHRAQKLRALASEPLAQRHLRVCWENRAPRGNCSRCEKCVHAMIVLAECEALDRFTVFEGSETLAERIDALPRIRHLRRSFGELASSERLSPRVTRAVRELVERSRRAQSLPMRVRRFLGRRVSRWSRTARR
jgi:hypothetical protein